MKFLLKFICFLSLLSLISARLSADLFVETVASTSVGLATPIDYISTDMEAPTGDLYKVVVIVDDFVVAESFTASGTLSIVFSEPGTIHYRVNTYNTSGSVIDSVSRSINVYGIGMIEPVDNTLVGLGSRLFLGAAAIFEDKLVESVIFQSRPSGRGTFEDISGSRDDTVPYATLFEPPSTGLWEVRAVATHSDGSSSYSSPIVIQVTSNNGTQPSFATILDPSGGSSVQAGIPRMINVDVSSSTGTIRGVDMYVDGELINSTVGMDVSYPFQFEWTPMRPGKYSLVAILTDNSGMKWASDAVEVVASDDRPHAELQLPEDGSYVDVGKPVSLVAIASGQGGARERVQGVEFLVNGNAIPASEGSSPLDTDAPYSVIWTPEFPGQYFVQARVIDAVTGVSYQTPSIQVNAVETSPPVAVLLAPYQGDLFYSGETVDLKATARSHHGLIESVEFFVNDVSVGYGEATDGVFHLTYTFSSPGLYQVFARATSDSHHVVNSSSVAFTVAFDNGKRPSVVIESPAQGALFTTGDTVQLVANAQDEDSTISQVEFFVNQEPIGDPDTSYPFTVDEFTFNNPGLYRFSAIGTDSDGNVSKKDFVEVRAVAPSFVRPEIEISNPIHEATFEVGNTVYIEVNAHDADGNVAEVYFEINGEQIGDSDTTYPFQSSFYPLERPGLYRVAATAIDNEGYLSSVAKTVFYVVPSTQDDTPQFNPIHDHRDFLTQLYIDLFSRGPTDAEMNRFLEKLEFGSISRAGIVELLRDTAEFQNIRHSQNAYHSIMGEWPTSMELASALGGIAMDEPSTTPDAVDDVGNDPSRATMLSSEGDVFSGNLEQSGDVDLFTFQMTVENLVTVFTTGPSDTVGMLIDSQGTVVEYDDDSGEFFNFAIQRVLSPGIYSIGVSGWAGSLGSYTVNLMFGEDVVLPEDSDISNAELDSTVQFIYDSDAFKNRYGPVQSMDSDTNRRAHFSRLFENRYGFEASAQQMLQGSNRLLVAESVASFTAAFVINDKVGLVDYIYNLPNVSSRDDAAFLLRAFLKDRPEMGEIETLEPLSFLEKVETLFASEDYLSRFVANELDDGNTGDMVVSALTSDVTTEAVTYEYAEFLQFPEGDPVSAVNPFFNIKSNADGWKFVEWLGWISDIHYPWIYHEHLGWIQVKAINPEELWVWNERLDWSYFAADLFPVVYRYSDEQWIQLEFSETPGEFDIEPIIPGAD